MIINMHARTRPSRRTFSLPMSDSDTISTMGEGHLAAEGSWMDDDVVQEGQAHCRGYWRPTMSGQRPKRYSG